MPEKLTLTVYLERRGAVKALTRIEAEVFGVPYPLLKGWATRHGATEITADMIEQLQEKIGHAKSSTAEKAQRGLDGVEGVTPSPASTQQKRIAAPRAAAPPAERLSPIPGFVLRQARRYRARKQAPWA
jgi:hypothetical protein